MTIPTSSLDNQVKAREGPQKDREDGPSATAVHINELLGIMRASRGSLEDPDHWGGGVVLIGAGCSYSAGIPLGRGVVDLALRHLASKAMPADVLATMDGRAVYNALRQRNFDLPASYDAPDFYGELFEHVITESNAQRRVIRDAIKQGNGRINWAHVRLGQLVVERYLHTILTTNFDQLALDGMVRAGVLPAVADGLEALNRIIPAPPVPQLVHLHGSMHAYTLRNGARAVQETQESTLAITGVTTLLQACDFLLVVGYAGGEEGVMTILERALKAYPDRKVFWAMHGDTPSPRLRRLSESHKLLRLLAHQDADALFDYLACQLQLTQPGWIADPPAWWTERAHGILPPEKGAGRALLKQHDQDLVRLSRCFAENQGPYTDVARANTAALAEGRFGDVLASAAAELPGADLALQLQAVAGIADAVLNSYRIDLIDELERGASPLLRQETPALAAIPEACPTLLSVARAQSLSGKFELAARFARKALEVARTMSLNDTTVRTVHVALDDVGRSEEALGELQAAEAVYRESLELARQLHQRLGTPEAARDLSVSLNNVARVAMARGELDVAEADYQESLDLTRDLHRRLNTPEAARDVSISLANVARVAMARGALDDAQAAHVESLQLARELHERLGTPEAARDFSIALDNVARVARARGALDDAEEAYRESLSLRRDLHQRLRTPQVARDLSVSLDDVAGLALARGALDDAESAYRESLDLTRDLYQRVATPEAARDLSVSLDNVAGVAMARGALDEAEVAFRESLHLRRGLHERLGTPEAIRDVSVSLNNLARVAVARRSFDAAEVAYRESLSLRRDLFARLGTPEAARDLSVVRYPLALVRAEAGDFVEARALLADALGAAQVFNRMQPSSDAASIIALIEKELAALPAG